MNLLDIIEKAKQTGGILTPSETMFLALTASTLLVVVSALPENIQQIISECLRKSLEQTSPESKPEPSET